MVEIQPRDLVQPDARKLGRNNNPNQNGGRSSALLRTFQKFYEQSENISVRFSNCNRCEISIEGLKFVQGRKKADKRKSLSGEMSYVTYRFHFVIVGRELHVCVD